MAVQNLDRKPKTKLKGTEILTFVQFLDGLPSHVTGTLQKLDKASVQYSDESSIRMVTVVKYKFQSNILWASVSLRVHICAMKYQELTTTDSCAI